MNEILLLLLWLVYFYLHSLLAATAVKTFFIRSFSINAAHIYRIGYNLFAFIGILILFWLQYIIPSALLFNTRLITNCIAIFLLATGLGLMIASIKNYDWKSFIGITPEKSYTLVIAGMNKYVRHPLYSSTMILVTGFFIGQPYFKNLLLMALMWIYLAIGIVYEERKLVKIYGAAYKAYQKKVKKMIPFIW
jgi:methanethiol S-methyltransferase